MRKTKFIALMSILACLLIVIPTGFAADNQTSFDLNETDDVLGADYYFDANVENDNGNGSLDNPYKKLTSSRIEDNSTIHLSSGVYDFRSSKTVSNVTIIGESASNTIIKRASFTTYTSFTLHNITLIDSTITNYGNFTAFNVIFANSSSDKYGGVINSNGNVYLENCSFINNTANSGGAIYVNGGNLTVINSSFINNSAELFGGAIASVRTNVNVINMTGKNNVARYAGGALYTFYGILNVTNSTFVNNRAYTGGALLVNYASYNIIANNRFMDNNASEAAAIYSFYNFNSTISDNGNLDENDLIETNEINMFIGDGNYTLYRHNPTDDQTIPNKYNLNDLGYITPVKNQGSNGNCWAFATLATLESNILKAFGDSLDLSESNMKNIFGTYSDYGWTHETNSGGIAAMGYNYLISWLGPVLESDDPYVVNSIFSPLLKSILHVQNVLFVQRTSFTDNDEIKRIIMTYGGIYTQIYANFSNGTQYYHNGTKANHAVVVVGWDDDLEFDGAPGKGGWIIKNSWGKTYPYNGFYYVSYYDTSCLPIGKIDSAFTFILNDTIKFDKNYQYDIQGKSDFFLNSSSEVWYKNKFIATDNEYLTAVSSMFQKNTKYEFFIYINDEFKLSQSGFTKPGYYTFNLNEFIPLTIGDTFEIVFRITVDGDAGVPISENVSFTKYYYKENTSFISYDGENWTDLFNLTWDYDTHNYYSQVACIKAFTVLNEIGSSITLSSSSDERFIIKAEVLNQYGNPITNGNILFTVDGENYTVAIVNGEAIIDLFVEPGSHNVSAAFKATGFISSKANGTFDSYRRTVVEITFENEYNPVIIHVNVTDQYGNRIYWGNVIFKMDNSNYTVNVINGSANLTHVFKNIGLNNVSISYNGEYYYSSKITSNIIVKSTIISQDDIKTFNSKYEFKLVDNYGKPLSNTNLTVTLGSELFNLTTDKNGIGYVEIDLAPKMYIITITNPFNNEIKTQNIKVVKRITENKALTMYYGAGSSYKVRVYDDNGNIAKNAKVKFTVNGKSYYRYSDSKGYALLKISLKPNKYTITAEYKGFKVSNKITVKSTIIAKDKTVKKGKTIKFKAKLLNSKGKILKNKKLTFKFKGKTYKVKTNSKGIATLKITKKYKVGKYTISTKYGALKIKNKITIKK